MDDSMYDRIEVLEEHVMGQNREQPGLLMRVDRLEWFVKGLIALASLGVVWKVLDVAGQLIANATLK